MFDGPNKKEGRIDCSKKEGNQSVCSPVWRNVHQGKEIPSPFEE
jgi:hypothetical protein